ncbi:MAG: NHL repeat-containing protein [Planctomycetes bacterium]|nr:NHL repeat-containing protein [Planctomycetota bacterium]
MLLLRIAALLALGSTPPLIPVQTTPPDEPGPAPLCAKFYPTSRTISELRSPRAACFDDHGQLYVLERGADRVRVIRTDSGATLRSFGGPGDMPSRFHDPRDIAWSTGAIAIADAGNQRVQIFAEDGSFRSMIGGDPEGPRFIQPVGIGIDSKRVAVADRGRHEVLVFDLQGHHERTLGGYGFDEGHLLAPEDVAIDSAGWFHVCDTGNHRLVTYDENGTFVREVGRGPSPADEFFDRPSGVLCYRDHLYVSDTRNHRIQLLDLQGRFIARWGQHAIRPHDGRGRLHYPTAVAIDLREEFSGDRTLAVVCEPFEDRLQLFTGSPDPEAPQPFFVPGLGSDLHFGQRGSIRGSLAAVVTEGESAVAIYDIRHEQPLRLHSLGRLGRGPGSFLGPSDVLMAPAKRIYVCDPLARKIEVYEHEWSREDEVRIRPRLTKLVRSIDTAAIQSRTKALAELPPLEFDNIELGPDDGLYLMDTRLGIIVSFGADFEYRRRFGGLGSANGQFRVPTDFCYSPEQDLLYVVDSGNARVQLFRADGEVLATIGGRGTDSGQFVRPFGVAAGPNGSFFVTDAALHRVQCFSGGRVAAVWGNGEAKGDALSPLDRLDPSCLYKPAGISTCPPSTDVLVMDWGHHRAQLSDGSGSGDFRVFGSPFFLQILPR